MDDNLIKWDQLGLVPHTKLGEIDAFDLSGSSVTRKIIVTEVKDYVYESMYIIPAPWGGLLQVCTTTKQAFVPGHLSRQPLGPGQ